MWEPDQAPSSSPTRQLLHQNVHRRVVVERDAIAVNGTKERAPSPNFGHHGGFAEPQFADALAKLRIACQLADAAGFASGELTKRQEFGEWTVHESGKTP